MEPEIETHRMESDLTLYDSSNLPLIVQTKNLTLTRKSDEVIQSILTFQVNLDLYQYINVKNLFNLNTTVRISSTGEDFQSEFPIQIEASLKPDLLPHLSENIFNSNQTDAYTLSQALPLPILMTENWLGLSVKQFQPSGEVGYETFWVHFSRWNLSMANASQEEMVDSVTSFIQDLVGLGFNAATQEIDPTSIENVAVFLRDLAETSANPIWQQPQANPSILSLVIRFFTEDDWQFQQAPGEPLLRLRFQGRHGQWTCTTRVIEEQNQFVFYSICPIKVFPDKLGAIAEFLTRANYGMTIGNFELDYSDGEIRYKTSIDVEGDRLTSALIKNLVYTNVTMMDTYLPGIRAIVHEGLSPEAAIAIVENPNSVEAFVGS